MSPHKYHAHKQQCRLESRQLPRIIMATPRITVVAPGATKQRHLEQHFPENTRLTRPNISPKTRLPVLAIVPTYSQRVAFQTMESYGRIRQRKLAMTVQVPNGSICYDETSGKWRMSSSVRSSAGEDPACSVAVCAGCEKYLECKFHLFQIPCDSQVRRGWLHPLVETSRSSSPITAICRSISVSK